MSSRHVALTYCADMSGNTSERGDGEEGSAMLELAVLGILSESPMHGYELRKRLAAVLGAFHRFSYGSLYPLLRKLQAEGFVTADDAGAAARIGGRSRVVYTLTAEGKERLAELLGEGGPASWEDEMFGVRFAFFG